MNKTFNALIAVKYIFTNATMSPQFNELIT